MVLVKTSDKAAVRLNAMIVMESLLELYKYIDYIVF
jgi:hypothetical protein